METTVGKLLLKNIVPSHLQPFITQTVLDKKGQSALYDKLSEGSSDTYRDIITNLARLGFEVSTRLGSTIPLADLNPLEDKKQRFDKLNKQLQAVKDGPGTKREKEIKMVELYNKFISEFEAALMEAGMKKNHTLASMIASGSRGSMQQYRQTVGANVLVNDEKNRPMVDFPISSSFAEGLSIPEYLAHSYGTRRGAIGTKLSIADSGYACFVGSTLIRMADFSTKRIDEIKIGDSVLGANMQGQTFPVTVTKVFNNGNRPVYDFIFRKLKSRNNYITLQATEHHEVLSQIKAGKKRKSLIKKRQLSKADITGFGLVVTEYKPTGKNDLSSFKFVEKKFKGSLPVYDFEVDYTDHLYVLANGAVVSNSKQLSRAAMPVKIEEHDCGTDNGVPFSVKDRDSIGAFLAQPVRNYKKNNQITGAMLSDLQDKGVSSIIVRSPMTCQSGKKHHSWAVCQMCAGKREKGSLPEIDSYLGVSAAGSLGEPLAQGMLNTKHTASSAVLGTQVASGFKAIDNLLNIPRSFQNKAMVSDLNGVVHSINVAPQGGYYVVIKDGLTHTKDYYVPAGFALKVKVGDKVEAGDVCSEGIVNPADIVKHKGIGEGRRNYMSTLKDTFDNSGMRIGRRNFEVLAKAAIDHVKVTHPDGLGQHLPDAVVSYSSLEKNYKPRSDAKSVRIDLALGKYLETPVLHYTIGTKLSSSMIKELKDHNIESVVVHDHSPGFEPTMVRLLDIPGHINDWAHQLYSSYLEKRLIKGVNEGLSSNIKGPSPILGLAYGVGFGEKKGEEEDTEE